MNSPSTKGHRYASVVPDADPLRVLWIGQGRSLAAGRPLFEALGDKGCAQIEAVAMNINSAFGLEVRRHCPKARVVCDLFHLKEVLAANQFLMTVNIMKEGLEGLWTARTPRAWCAAWKQ